MATALVFNRASDNYLFHGSQFKAGSGRDFLRLSTANNEAIIDLCNNSNIDISATDVFINGNRVVTSSGTSGSTLGSLEVTGTTVLQDLSAGATDISSTLNVAGAVTFGTTLDVTGALYIQDNQKAEVTIDYATNVITQRSAAVIVEGGVIVKAQTTPNDAPGTNPRTYSFISEGEGFFRGGFECENGITLFSGDITRFGYGTIYEASSNIIGNTNFDIKAKNIDISGTLNIDGSFTDGSFTLSSGAITGATSIDGTGDLTMGSITMTGFSVDADGDTVTKSIDNTNGGITNTGAITGATSIDGTGDLTMATITMTGFSVDANGAVQIGSGQNGSLTIGSGVNGGKIHSTATQHELVIDPFALDADRTTEDASGVVTILGDLVVRGNTTTFHSVNVDISDHNLTLASGTNVTAGMADGAGITIGNDSYATFTFDSNNTKWKTNIDLDVSGALSVSGTLSGATSIDGTGDLTMATITMTGFSVDADGDTVTKSIDNTNGGITNTGAIAGATSIDGTGDLTMDTITMTGFSVDADGDTVTKSIDNTNGGITNTGAIAGATSIDGTGDLTMATITMTGFSVDTDGDTVTKSLSLAGNLTTSNNIAQIPVTKSTFTLVTSSLGDLSTEDAQGGSTFVGSSGDGDFQNATNYSASRIVLSGNSLIKMEFKVNFISSPEADQTISFRVRRTIGATTTTVFTDENIGSNMGVTFRNVYNGTFIDDLGAATPAVTNNTSVTYQLQYKRNCPSGDTISTQFGIVTGGNYIFLQELYCP